MPNNLQYIRTPDEPFACPVGVALWNEYRKRNPNGLAVPPIDGLNNTDPELEPYLEHIDVCEDCNEV